jgi:hypothetical protein
MARHPHAFYVDFGDFLWFRVGDLKAIKYNGGFARAAVVSAAGGGLKGSLLLC